MDETTREARGGVYRQHLNHLTDEAWAFAVEHAVNTLEWFPTIVELISFSNEAPRAIEPPAPRAADAYYRRAEGNAARRVKGHEHHGDPDWSMAELSREKGDLAAEFYDWLYERGGAKDAAEFQNLFDRWVSGRWEEKLTKAAEQMLLFAVRARQKTQGAADLPFRSRTEQLHYEAVVRTNPIRIGEGSMAYVERLTVIAGGMEPTAAVLNDPQKTEWFDPVTVARLMPAVPEVEIRLPYRDAPDNDDVPF